MQERQMSQIDPGSWLGIFGGGQLGRMFTHVAQARGYHVVVFEAEEGCPAGQAADRHLCPSDVNDNVLELVETFAQACDAVTLEFENVSADWVRVAERHSLARPGAQFLEICQNRVREKSSLRAAGFPVTPFISVRSAADVKAAAGELGWPLIVKTSRSGYDGKGQVVVRSPQDVEAAWTGLSTDDAIAEQRIDFVAEVSMLGARNARGQVVTYPLIENTHANHILDLSRCPVSPSLQRYEEAAREIVTGVATDFQVQGLFCVEFFVDANKGLLVNEIAPRPHNSGHLTIEAFPVSQFEQQLRAVCNMPLAKTDEFRPAAMANLLGDLWFTSSGQNVPAAADITEPRRLCWENVFRASSAYLHLYGKAQPRIGRKMGHLTCTADTADEAVERVQQLRASLCS